MNKTLNNNRLALDSTTHIVYNSSMTSNNDSNKGTKKMRTEHSRPRQAKVIELQKQQRKAEDAGNMTKADELQKKIEYFYSRNS